MHNGPVNRASREEAAGPRDGLGRSRPPRLTDVARAAGVSAQTVSNVLNGRTGFGEETRERVLAAAERLQFRPNRAAQQLRTRRSKQLGLHLPAAELGAHNTFSVTFLRAVVQAAAGHDHQVVVFTHPVDEHSMRAGLLHAGVDGFVLFNIDPADPRPGILAQAGIPFAVFGRTSAELPQAWVDIDNEAAVAAVVDHLADRGHRRFGYVGYAEREFWNAARLQGARRRLRERGLELPERWQVRGTYEHVRARVPALLRAHDRPDALICASDSLAVLVHGLADRAGVRPGADLAITGFDGMSSALELAPPLTTVALPLTAAAEAVVRMLLDQVAGAGAPAAGTILPTELVIGGTS